jgi:hypothetical protein
MTLSPDEIPQSQDRVFLREFELAARWRLSVRSLQRRRAERLGPPHMRVGRSILYRLDDIVAFEDRMSRAGGDLR